MKSSIIFAIILLLHGNLLCQTFGSLDFEDPPKSITEVVKQLGADTVVFYYNEGWQLVRPTCAIYYRISRVDAASGNFTGHFTDYLSADSTTVVEGNYSNGRKEGKFNFYFANGQLSETGEYRNDKKDGIWDYYYENGTKRQTLDFKSNEVLVNEFWNEKGEKRVVSGNGDWYRFDSAEKFLKISGEILHGRRNGTWKIEMTFAQGDITNVEKYKDGKFVSGKMFSRQAGKESYSDTAYCIVEKPQRFLIAERFQMNRCYKYEKSEKGKWEFATYPGGMRSFYEEIWDNLVIDGELVRGMIRIQMTIDTDGTMTNFQPVTNLGHEADLIRVLRTMKRWKPTTLNGKPRSQPKIISLEIR